MKITKSGKKDIAILIVLLLITQIIPFELLPLKAIAAAGEDKIWYFSTNNDITSDVEYNNITFKVFTEEERLEGDDNSYTTSNITINEGVTLKANVVNIYGDYLVEYDDPEFEPYKRSETLYIKGTIEANEVNIYGDAYLSGGTIKADRINIIPEVYENLYLETNYDGHIIGDVYVYGGEFRIEKTLVEGDVHICSEDAEYMNFGGANGGVKGTVYFHESAKLIGGFDGGLYPAGADGYVIEKSLGADYGTLLLNSVDSYVENNTDDMFPAAVINYSYFTVGAHAKGTLIPSVTKISEDCSFGENTSSKLKKEIKQVKYKNDCITELMYTFSLDEKSAFNIQAEENDNIALEDDDNGNVIYYIPAGETLTLNVSLKDDYKTLGKVNETINVVIYYTELGLYENQDDDSFVHDRAAEGQISFSANVIDKVKTPENPYSLSGTKGTNADILKEYGQDYYTTDVTLTPAKGYQVASKADGSNARESLIYKVKTEDVEIFLVDEDGDMTDAIEVGTIIPNVEEPEEVVEEKKEETKEEVKEEEKEEGVKSGSGTVTVSKCYYGGSYEVKTSSSTNDASKATIKYKSKVTGFYLPGAPSGVGDYVVEATFPGNDKYESYVATCDFSIEYLPVPTTPYSIKGKVGNNDFYVTDVSIKPLEGYLISDSLNGTYSESIDITETKNIRYVYLKKADTGEMTDSIPVNNIKMDKVQPSISGVVANKEYFSDSFEFDVSDDNLSKVLLDGKEVKFDGKKCVINVDPDGDSKIYRLETIDQAGNQNTLSFTVSAAWLQNKVIIPDKFIKLKGGDTYTLPEGKWKIEYEDGTTDPNVYLGGYKVTLESDARMKFTLN